MSNDVTQLLQAASDGSREAFDALLPKVYDELRRIAHLQLRGERPGHTLNTTALVHEAYLKLLPATEIDWQNRNHFFGIAARAMRRVLVDDARRRKALKRGGGQVDITFEEQFHSDPVGDDELLALDEALQQLEALSERQARVVEYRFFAGLKIEEIADLLEVSEKTVRRDWQAARAWLARAVKAAS